MTRRAAVAVIAMLALVFGVLSAVVAPSSAQAAVGSQFNPGLIISDAKFFDGGAMGAGDVQTFLNTHGGVCQSGYACLRSYRQATVTRAAVAGRCSQYTGVADESAASIITRVGVACGISQAVLIVMLQKEQGLVTSTAPSATRYRIAMGYGCPDTAPCDTTYYGFFNQVYMAALQFKRYAANPTGWNHIAGRVNAVRYHPNGACGSGSVLIQNQATAGLYNYTPYQPNAAALANVYGLGDGCSSYGNRNFWAYYTDWFGPTTTSDLVRTPQNATVYVIASGVKYPVPNLDIMAAYSPLGGVSYVSQSYLDSLSTGSAAGHIVRGSDGGLYFIDAGIKTQFTSCAMVIDYGGSCDPSGYVQLTDLQIAAYHTGPYATQVLGTTAGGRYLLDDGTKREILDDASQAAAGLGSGFNLLTEAGIADRPLGAPIVRDDVFIGERGGSSVYLYSGRALSAVPTADVAPSGVAARVAGTLRADSLALITGRSPDFTGVAGSSTAGPYYLLTALGRYQLTVPATSVAGARRIVPQSVIDSYPDKGALALNTAVKTPSDDTIYLVSSVGLRPVASWEALVAISGSLSPTFVVAPASALAPIARGSALLTPGMMYRTIDDPRIFLIDGTDEKVSVGSFDYPTAAGFPSWSYATAAQLAGYAADPAAMSYVVICGSTRYVAAGGALRPIPVGTDANFPFAPVTLSPSTCAQTRIGVAAVSFVRTPDGAIYQLTGGQKRHVGAATLAAVNAGAGWMNVPQSFVATIPSGPSV